MCTPKIFILRRERGDDSLQLCLLRLSPRLPDKQVMIHDLGMDGYEPGAIWPVLNAEEVQIREVFSRFGLAMYTAQVLEHGMVNALLVIQLLPTRSGHASRSSWEEVFDQFYNGELAKTFGNIAQTLKKTEFFPADFIERLFSAKQKRDKLAHRFFRENDVDFTTDLGRKKMLMECEEIIEIFQGLDVEIDNFMSPLQVEFGITSELIEEHVICMATKIKTYSGNEFE
jgi:hypothetical protein